MKIIFFFLVITSCTLPQKSRLPNGKKIEALGIDNSYSSQWEQIISKPSFEENKKYVDIVVINSPESYLTPNIFKKQFIFAQDVFNKHGVFLNIIEAKTLLIPSEWHEILVSEIKGEYTELDFYKKINAKKNSLTKHATDIFNTIIENHPNNDKTIFVLGLNNISMSYMGRSKNGDITVKPFKVGGLSFPPYILGNRIPRNLRGIITISNQNDSTLAHELGHKLINVSHEGKDKCPKFSGSNIPGLMGYHGEKEIYAGKDGRWHKERLLLSPFLYSYKNNKKVWNPSYKDTGEYSDPIYKKTTMDPACSN